MIESLLMSSVHMPEKCIMQKRPLIVSLNYTSTLLLILVIDFKIQNLYLYCQILQCHYPPPPIPPPTLTIHFEEAIYQIKHKSLF